MGHRDYPGLDSGLGVVEGALNMKHALALALVLALSTACTDIVGVTVYDET